MRPECRVPGCPRVAAVRGLCSLHYNRERRGVPLEPEHRRGDPDGYGLYGVLDDDGSTVLCHECGERRLALGTHVRRVHGMTARQYKLAHGLPLTRGLTSRAAHEAASAQSRSRIGDTAWARLVAARDPLAASAARTTESLRHAREVDGAAQAIANGKAAGLHEVRQCPICGATWCPVPGVHGSRRRVTCGRPECAAELISRVNAQQKIPAPVLARWRADHRRGETWDAIGAREGVTGTAIRFAVRRVSKRDRRVGVQWEPPREPGRSGAPAGRDLLDSETRELRDTSDHGAWVAAAQRMIDAGASQVSIARALGMAQTTISQRLRTW